MDELIYRDALIEKMGERAKKYSKIDECTELTIYEDMHIVNNAPAVDTVEVDKAMAWLEGYTMTDTKQIYSNGIVFVPLFRVKQAFVDKAYNGLQEG